MLQSDLNTLLPQCHNAVLVLNEDKSKLVIIKSPYNKIHSPPQNLVIHDHNCISAYIIQELAIAHTWTL